MGGLIALIFALNVTGIIPLQQLIAVAGSLTDRTYFISGSIQIFLEHPLIGVGFGWWREAWIPWASTHEIPTPEIWEFPHNDYMSLLSEGGIVGTILGIGAGVQIFILIMQAATRS